MSAARVGGVLVEGPAGRASRLTVVALGALMAYADGFVLTTIQGAVGATQRADHPFSSWLLHATSMVPVFVIVVHRVLAHARRRAGSHLRRPRAVVVAALLVALAGSGVGVAAVAASGLADYRLQVAQIEHTQAVHAHGGAVAPQAEPACGAGCAAQRASLAVDVRAAAYGSAAIVGVNAVLVAWVVALRGGSLDAAARHRRAPYRRARSAI
jgi:hypothetical protein